MSEGKHNNNNNKIIIILLRGTIVNRTYGTHKNLYHGIYNIYIYIYISLLSLTIFGPIIVWSTVITILISRDCNSNSRLEHILRWIHVEQQQQHQQPQQQQQL